MSLKRTGRRLKMAYVSKDFILKLFEKNNEVSRIKILEGVPENAIAVGIQYNFERDCFCVLFEHSSFDELGECEVIPEVDIVCQNFCEKPRLSMKELSDKLKSHLIKGRFRC